MTATALDFDPLPGISWLRANPGGPWQPLADELEAHGLLVPNYADRLVVAHPDVVGLRHVAALAWEHYGDAARAEFIRVQCELAGYEPGNHPGIFTCEGKGPPAQAGSRKRCKCRPCVLRRRERELWHRLPTWAAFAESFSTAIVPDTESTRFWIDNRQGPLLTVRRGFVEVVSLTCGAMLQHAAALFAAAPITSVTLTDAIHERDYGGGDVRYAVYRNQLGPVYQWLVPSEGLAYSFAERNTREEFEPWLSNAAVSFGRHSAKLPEIQAKTETPDTNNGYNSGAGRRVR